MLSLKCFSSLNKANFLERLVLFFFYTIRDILMINSVLGHICAVFYLDVSWIQ